MTARCELTDLLVDQCAHCKGQLSVDEQVAAEKPTTHSFGGVWIAAQYAGACYRCGEPIAAGDHIRPSDPHRTSGWIGICCAPEEV